MSENIKNLHRLKLGPNRIKLTSINDIIGVIPKGSAIKDYWVHDISNATPPLMFVGTQRKGSGYIISGTNDGDYFTNQENFEQDEILVASALSFKTWVDGSSLNTSRESIGGFGQKSSTIAAGGDSTNANEVEEWNGSTWTALSNLSNARQQCGSLGNRTAGLIFGGQDSSDTGQINTADEYNGTTWSSTGTLSQAKRLLRGGSGKQSLGFCVAGYDGSNAISEVEEYDGSSWSLSDSLNTARFSPAVVGGNISESFTFGGKDSSELSSSESYDGTSWTTENSLNTAKRGYQGLGSKISALATEGYDGSSGDANNEEFDGTSWFISGLTNNSTNSTSPRSSIGNPSNGLFFLNAVTEELETDSNTDLNSLTINLLLV